MNIDLIVTGSADHGLRVYSQHTGSFKRELYDKKNGHTDWVTDCKILSDNRIVSSGMDSKICLWQKDSKRCNDLIGHQATISQIEIDKNDIMLSSSYDTTIRVWSLKQ